MEDLEALRNAALATLRKKQEEQVPQGIQVVSAIPQQGQVNPEELLFTPEYDEIPAEVERMFLRQQGRGWGKFRRGRGRGRGGFDQNFNPNPNVIVITTVPAEGEEEEKKKQAKTFFVRPQDKWTMKDTGSGSSSPKTRDTSKFRRYDDDTDSDDEDDEATKAAHDSDNEHKPDEEYNKEGIEHNQMSSVLKNVEPVENAEQSYYENVSETEVRTSELSQTQSDIEAAMGQTSYEAVSEVESDAYYGSDVQARKTIESDNCSEGTATADQSVLSISGDPQSNIPGIEVAKLFSDEKSDSEPVLPDREMHLDRNVDRQSVQKAEAVTSTELIAVDTQIEHKEHDNNQSPIIPEGNRNELERLSPEMHESDSKLSSSKFSRFNRKRRNSSGSESDASGYSDVSSWSTSRQSPLNTENKTYNNLKPDVSSAPFSKGSISEKEFSDIDSESDSESDSDSSSSASDDSSVSLSLNKSTDKQKEIEMPQTTFIPSVKKKSDSYKSRESPHKQSSFGATELGPREKEVYKYDMIQRKSSDVSDKKEEICLKRNEKEPVTSVKSISNKERDGENHLRKIKSDASLLDSAKDNVSKRPNKEKYKQLDNEKYKSNHSRQEEMKHSTLESFQDQGKQKQSKQVKHLFPIKVEDDFNTSGVEQIVLDARRQKLESEKNGKEVRPVSLSSKVAKDKSQSKNHGHLDSHSSRSQTSTNIYKDRSNRLKDKSAEDKHISESSRHEKSSKHKRNRSITPPKAYLKAKNKKTEQKVMKRFGSISPPKAYSKDLKEVEKRRKSSHSGERKRKLPGSVKKKRKSDVKHSGSESDSGKSISSLSDSDSDSETENWRDKKSGVSRKRDDIERERRMRRAAERQNIKKDKRENNSTNDRETQDRGEERYSGRSDEREGRSKAQIDSFDARDYRQHINWENRHRSRRDNYDRKPNERVYYRKNKTFVEEEPLVSRSNYFEEEVSDDSRTNDKKGIVSVIKTNRKRLSSEAELEDIKISSKHTKHKHEDLNKKVKKERLIISVRESSEDEKTSKPTKVRKSDSKKKKTKHKSQKNTAGDGDLTIEQQSVKVTFNDGKEEKPRTSVYDRLGAPVSKQKDSSKHGGSSAAKKKEKSSKSKEKDHSKRRDVDRKDGNSSAIRRVYREDEAGGNKQALNAKILKIQEKNAEILRRRQEIEQDKQKYG